MDNLQDQFEEAQTVYSINRMMGTCASTFDLFKFLLGEQARYIKFERFLYLYHKNDANLAKIISDYMQRSMNSNWIQAAESARQLQAAQQSMQKHDYSQLKIELIHGDKQIFDVFDKNFHFSKRNTLLKPGRNSADAYMIAFPGSQLFVKPTESLEKALNESKAYELSKELKISQFFLPSCVVKIKKNSNSFQYAVVTKILPYGFVSLDELETQKPGANDGFVKSLVDAGTAHKLAVFDYLIDNSDRHKNNIFISGNQFYLIDHTEAFRKKENGFVPGYLRLNSYKIDKKLPISKNELEIKNWLVSLQLSDIKYVHKLEQLITDNSPCKAINAAWEKYYGE